MAAIDQTAAASHQQSTIQASFAVAHWYDKLTI
jgi:hypothetical protein